MSKNRDYTKYSKGPVESIEPVETVVEDIIEPVETVAEDIIEPVETVVEDVQPVEVEQEPKEEPKEEPKYATGIVTDCIKLNVREYPNSTAMILGTVHAGIELIIDNEESTEDFYKIYTSVGLEGYCMKKFVTIMP